jgi:outer membrane protein OmpA-like peptidoglycan-associated protein
MACCHNPIGVKNIRTVTSAFKVLRYGSPPPVTPIYPEEKKARCSEAWYTFTRQHGIMSHKAIMLQNLKYQFFYNSITSIKSPSFYFITFSANLTNLTALVSQSLDYLHRSDRRNTLIYAHTTSRTLPTYNISLG